MSRPKSFNDFSYGVGLEYTSSKQVKDKMKSDLDDITKLARSYREALKIDPEFDISKLVQGLREFKNFTDTIKNSGNPFENFVDKGLLDRVAALEKGMGGVAQKSADAGKAMSGAVKDIKDAGSNKFGNELEKSVSSMSAQIKVARKELVAANKAYKEFEQLGSKLGQQALLENPFSAKGVKVDKATVKELESWIKEYENLGSQLATLDENDILKIVPILNRMQELGTKMEQTLMLPNIANSKGFNNFYRVVNEFKGQLKANFESISQEYDTQLEKLAQKQEEAKNKLQSKIQSKENLQLDVRGGVDQPVTLKPHVVPSEWANIINSKLADVEKKLRPIAIKPTLAGKLDSGKAAKDAADAAARMDYVIKVNYKFEDEKVLSSLDEKIKNMQTSLQHARDTLKGQTKFKLGWEWEDGSNFKEVVHRELNALKNVPVSFKVSNKRDFLSSVETIRKAVVGKLEKIDVTIKEEKIAKAFKDIPVSFKIANKDAILSEADSLRASIEEKFKNIGISLNMADMAKFMLSNAVLEDLAKDLRNGAQPVIAQAPAQTQNKNIEDIKELSNVSKEAQEEVRKIKSAIDDLKKNGIKSSTFSSLGIITAEGKQKRGSKKQLAEMLKEYNTLDKQLDKTSKKFAKTYDLTDEKNEAYHRDLARRTELEENLNGILQVQKAYSEHKLELAQKQLEAESKINAVAKGSANGNVKELNESLEKTQTLVDSLTKKRGQAFDYTTLAGLGEYDKQGQLIEGSKDKVAEQVAKYKEFKSAIEEVNKLLANQIAYSENKAKALSAELDALKNVKQETSEAFKIAKSYYEQHTKAKGKQQDSFANNMVNRALETVFNKQGKNTFSFWAKGHSEDVEHYAEMAKAYDGILQKIGYKLGDLKQKYDSAGKAFGFSAEAIAIPDKAIKSYDEAKTVLIGTGDASKQTEQNIARVTKRLTDAESAVKSLKKDGAQSEWFVKIGNIDASGKKQSATMVDLNSRYNQAIKAEAELERVRKNNLQVANKTLKAIQDQATATTSVKTSEPVKTKNSSTVKKETADFEKLNQIVSKEHADAFKIAIKAEEEKRAKSKELTDQLKKELDVIKQINKYNKNEKNSGNNSGKKSGGKADDKSKSFKSAEKQLDAMDHLLTRVDEYVNRKGSNTGLIQKELGIFGEAYNELSRALLTPKDKRSSNFDAYLDNLVERAKGAAKNISGALSSAISGENVPKAKLSDKLDAWMNSLTGGANQGTFSADVYNNIKNGLDGFAQSAGMTSATLGALNTQNNAFTLSLVDADGQTHKFTISIDQLNKMLKSQEKQIGNSTNFWKDFGKSMWGSIKQIGHAALGGSGIYRFIGIIKQGITSVKELDTAMTELKKVTDESDATYTKFLKDASTTASEIGTTLKDFVNATADFARLGYSIGEASSLAKAASIYTNIGDEVDSIDDATSSIISTMKAFGIESKNAMNIVDKFNEVGNRFAITSGGIGEALRLSASALFEAGNTIDESIALITAANSVVQNPNSVGTALKTLSLRLRGAKVELEEAGLETDAMAESTATLRKKLLALTGGKVDIMLDANTFKNSTQILREMSEVWDKMTDIQQADCCLYVQKCA